MIYKAEKVKKTDIGGKKTGTISASGKAESKTSFSILVVDDETGIRDFLQRALGKTYSLVEVAASAEEADELRSRVHFDLMIVDICLPGNSGVDWLRTIVEPGWTSDVVFMTAFADVDKAIDALRIGASDFILKPFRLEQMMSTVRRCLEKRRLLRENFILQRRIDNFYPKEGMIGRSAPFQKLCQLISRVAPSPSVVLIEGETGTGKELVASAIHKESGRTGPFVPVNCGAISAELIESELFGHLKGAFTGAQQARDGLFSYADGGTLFLDEISEMPLALQAKLLRVLEEKSIRPVGGEREISVDVRIVAATNRNLVKEKDDGRFRADLFYRLNVVTLAIPPLRERREDIVPLVEFFSTTLARQLGLLVVPFDLEDFRELEAYNWPGNVRELKNMVERCLLLGSFPTDLLKPGTAEENSVAGYPSSWTLEAAEKDHIKKVLARSGGNKTRAAEILGVSRKTLTRKLYAWQQELQGGEK
ncbi:sigma-54 dependent transcriptional regulator [Kiloniella laminariae]|uniref:Sigma-54 dependent transcriptional regulator n=1 Tax=Kiloniella laminariae TaxID=454162 RepID=A0ABT4LRI6_9PROT|nr:sigma-54 dependent transcriptional regulator [Kiloniella laminariae]MCZ4282552.1 sigma-54 dependent transcriptional regulator [Kiloniella laminariae]